MFTGIIEAIGTVRARRGLPGGGARMSVEVPFARELAVGESVSVNGVCLTVAAPPKGKLFEADLSPETLDRTRLGRLSAGARVNLERALLASARLGGHVVQGHVDTVARVTAIRDQRSFHEVRVSIPAGFSRYLVEKGSVAVDGISLTVASLSRRDFGVAVIPATWEGTNLAERTSGDEVHLEFDVLAKYVERMLGGRR